MVVLDTNALIYDALQPKRLTPLALRAIEAASENGEIAALSQSRRFSHGDPADRIISATALYHQAKLVSADARLRKLEAIEVVW